jgi:hypothetical protein
MLQPINQINIINILDKLWIQYKNLWSWTYWIIQDWRLTDWRRINIKNNYIHDFSKNRAQGWNFAFVKRFLNLTNHETFRRFKENFNIENNNRPYHNRWSPKQKKYKVVEPYTRKRLKQ